mmetsp:Transcript_88655/g.108519  ORF Transcript_88655/g.108519 Transcript_88655/m.108519 type:complete len:90 (+) Transcript_88655:666-935(+)
MVGPSPTCYWLAMAQESSRSLAVQKLNSEYPANSHPTKACGTVGPVLPSTSTGWWFMSLARWDLRRAWRIFKKLSSSGSAAESLGKTEA